jgi:hypothetical protein
MRSFPPSCRRWLLAILLLPILIPAAEPPGGLLERWRNVHPRLFVDQRRLDELRALIRTSTEYREYWTRFVSGVSRRPPPAALSFENSVRGLGDRLWDLTAAYAFSGDRAFLQSAEQWALALSACPERAYTRGDFGTGHILCALALFSDWCHADISERTRATVAQALLAGGRQTLSWIDTNYSRIYLCNQLHIRLAGVGMAALALDGEEATARNWIGAVEAAFGKAETAAGDDGASVEGVGYGQYDLAFSMRYYDCAKTLLGLNHYSGPWWYNNGLYQLYLTTPRHAWIHHSGQPGRGGDVDMNVDLGDCPRYNWYGPDYLLRGIARETRNGYAQWLAETIDQGHDEAGDSWLNLVRQDASVVAQPPTSLPTLRHFDNIGLVSARSAWSGDESLVTFSCGPYFGHRGVDGFTEDLGGGHAHPTANSFAIFGAGEWLISFPGYLSRMAQYENTLVVDGHGQLNQPINQGWWDPMPLLTGKLHPRIVTAASNPAFDRISGDATPVYGPLTRYVRHLLFIKPNVLIVLDDIAAAASHDYQLRFHCEQTSDRCRVQADGTFMITGDHARLSIAPLTMDGVEAEEADAAMRRRHGGMDLEKACITMTKHADRWRNAVAFSWSDVKASPAAVQLETRQQQWIFTIGGTPYRFSWETATLQGP